AILLFALLDSRRIYFRADMTGCRRLSLSSYCRSLAAGAGAPVRLTYYRSGILASLYPGVRDIPDFLAEYSYFGPVSVGTVDADRHAAELLSDYGIYGRQIQTVGSNRTEFVTVYSAVVIEYKGAWEVLPFVLSSDGLEYAVTVRLQRLLSGRRPSVQLLVGNGMTLSDDYGYVAPWLEAQGFSCTELRADRPLSGQLERGRTLCVFGSSEITAAQSAEVEQFLSGGGRAFFAVSPYSADIADSWRITENAETGLTDMLNSYGFGFSRNLAGDASCARITMESDRTEDGSAAELHTRQLNYPLWISVLPQRNAVQGMTAFWPVALQPDSDSVAPLLLSSPAAYQIAPDFDSAQSLFETNPFLLEDKSYAQDAVEQGAAVLGASLKGTVRGLYAPGDFEAEAVLVSDPYFVNSLMLGYIGGQYGDYRNLDFLASALLKLEGSEELAALYERSLAASRTQLYKTSDYASFASARLRTVLCEFAVVPALIAAAWACLFLLRKKRIASLSEEIRGKKG
ncbi:MAG: GldG family protein, partial [Treponemataceae bacterium]|nr:GldG family protein [Treponemataceae bacterium]